MWRGCIGSCTKIEIIYHLEQQIWIIISYDESIPP